MQLAKLRTKMESELAIVARHAMSAPIDFTKLADALGVDFTVKPLPSGQSGYIERNGDNFTIVVNAREPEVRRRFTAAHEFAHYLLHRDLMAHGGRMNRHIDSLYDEADEDGEDSAFKSYHETQANRLAAQIVMPAPVVRGLRKQGRTVEEIAKMLRVSKPAMEVRLKTLDLD